jgi:hypothetical protein
MVGTGLTKWNQLKGELVEMWDIVMRVSEETVVAV